MVAWKSTSPSSLRRRLLAPAIASVLVATTFSVTTSAAPAAPPGAAGAQPRTAEPDTWLDRSLPAARRARALVRQMSLEQKVATIDQNSGTGVPELGVPPIRSIDGCCGVTGTVDTTAMPTGIALASTFSPAMARSYGRAIGEEAYELGFNSLAGPTMDLLKTPFNGRMWESYGEDPLLSGSLTTAQVNGEETNDVWAIPKHYNLNNQETRRGHVSARVSERTLNEVYARPWEMVVKGAQPGAVMCSFNRVNGVFACSNRSLLRDTLKGRFGLDGYVTSDFDAGHGFGDYEAGLDVSGPTETYAGAALVEAVRNGVVPGARVTDAAFRVLYTMIESGVYDNPPPGAFTVPAPGQAALDQEVLGQHNAVAAHVGDASAVLLKNSGSALPLAAGRLGSLAVIGADADHYIAGGGAGAVANPAELTTIVEGLTDRAEGVDVSYAAGVDSAGLGDTMPGPAPVASDSLTPDTGSGNGLRGQYWLNPESAGAPFSTRVDTQVNLRSGIGADFSSTSRVTGIGSPLNLTRGMSARWTGTLTAPAAGTYQLSLSHLGSARLFLDGEEVIDDAGTTYGTQSVSVSLTEGQDVAVRIDYVADAPNQFNGGLNDQAGPMIRFGWTLPEGTLAPRMQTAVDLAEDSDVAVVVVRDYTSEGSDRGTLTLPQDQDRLVRAVAAANPRTIVVVATSGPVLMPWLADVPAVLQLWYGGQVQGRTVARTLFGDVNPSGRLPVTFPATEAQVNRIGAENPFRHLAIIRPTDRYEEGVFVGYKGYDRAGIKPLFPFGHGLSYTRYRYSKLQLRSTGRGPSAAVVARFQVRNVGSRDGTEVAQVYTGKLPGAQSPKRALAGFTRIKLEAGASKTVRVRLDKRALQSWKAGRDRWVTARGNYTVSVGSSSRSLQLSKRVRVR
ncbi:glycoside hydrolase family 3 protein [Nocardioides sp. zg-DK7169]|uniref:beta-glucosidase n=1 Tax=Nocardioides sp. zg-DK7169 TaxID=2736600 RepID=UPI001557075F|nr:glycoside hydrolase family 3 C-terminal domain-containing protein [Nocardioides sp. zg-DK7169]NPC97819.1 beta-glucosidase [Nocardioides sp. zg-DK7169]